MAIRSADVRAEFADNLNRLRDKPASYDDPEIRRLLRAYVDDLYFELRRVSPGAKVMRDPQWEKYPHLEIEELQRLLEGKEPGGEEAFRRVQETHQPQVERRASAYYEELAVLRERLYELAPLAEVRRAGPSGEWYPLSSSWDESSQGLVSLRYRELDVHSTAEVARSLGFVDGVDLVVLHANDDRSQGILAALRVEDRVDVEIVKRCLPPPTRTRRSNRRDTNDLDP